MDLTPSVCMCPLIDHGQQPMKMHTEVTLLYNYIYTVYRVYIRVYISVPTYISHTLRNGTGDFVFLLDADIVRKSNQRTPSHIQHRWDPL